ncbi:MAG: hypothetical protein PUE12_17860 [Oscillospiraceae bacterium]|nr:hypothetical protein [Oscillospiraceae bacterium]
MLFFVFIIILVLSIIGTTVIDEWEHEGLHIVSCIMVVVSFLAILVSLIFFMVNYIGIEANIASNDRIYESLTYQYENAVFDDDDDAVGKKELYNQIQDWNKDLAFYQSIQDDFWIGIYVPNIYDQFEFIEYDEG